MKILRQLSYAFLFITLFTFNQCKKNKNKDEPKLPPETIVGAMTFGCKVNGEVFVPQDGGGRPGLFAQYANLGSGLGGGWFLSINVTDNKTQNSKNITINTDSLLVQSGTYILKKVKGNSFCTYFDFPNGSLNIYEIIQPDSGELVITKHDQTQRILSGNFHFNVTNQTGVKVIITEGRFDVRY